MQRYIAAIDQGTTSTRLILFDRDGNAAAVGQKEHRQIFPRPGWVEHDAAEIWRNTLEVAGEALAAAGASAGDIAAIGITNQRETTVLWDRRTGVPAVLKREILPALAAWAGRDAARRRRVRANFGDGRTWDPIRVLERYELLYHAELVPEFYRDRGRRPGADLAPGMELAADHRRIVATALGRLRGKLKYRPVVFELLPETFTLLQLQRKVEALTGMRLHKQNFRRLVENGRFLEPTRGLDRPARGRPARLFRFRKEVVRARLY